MVWLRTLKLERVMPNHNRKYSDKLAQIIPLAQVTPDYSNLSSYFRICVGTFLFQSFALFYTTMFTIFVRRRQINLCYLVKIISFLISLSSASDSLYSIKKIKIYGSWTLEIFNFTFPNKMISLVGRFSLVVLNVFFKDIQK